MKKLFQAINDKTGEVVNIIELNHSKELKRLCRLARRKILICFWCQQPVNVRFLKEGIWCFVCINPDCTNSMYDSDFAEGEEDYYNPEHFEDE